jgi:hypothetical protein
MKEGLYDAETLSVYLLYRLNALNSSCMRCLHLASFTNLIKLPAVASPRLPVPPPARL